MEKDYKVLYRKIARYVNFKYDLREKLTPGQKSAITRAYDEMRYVLRTNDLQTVRRKRGESDRQYRIRINKIARSANVKIVHGNKVLIRRPPEGGRYRFSNGKAEIVSKSKKTGRLIYEFDHVRIEIDDSEEDIYYKIKNCLARHPDAYSVNILARVKSVFCADPDYAAEWLTEQLTKTLLAYVIDDSHPVYNVTLRFFYKSDEQIAREKLEKKRREKKQNEKNQKNQRYRRGN